jgi:hypothetical protein
MGRPLAPAYAPTRPEIPMARALKAVPAPGGATASAPSHLTSSLITPQQSSHHSLLGPALAVRLAPPLEPATFVTWVQEQLAQESSLKTSDEVGVLEQKLVRALRDRNTAQALTLASVIVYQCPEHEVARRIKTRCAQQQRGATLAFPRSDAIPRMRLPWTELEGRNLPGRAAFLLSCLDGASTVEQIIDVSAMPVLLAYETLDMLVRDGIVELT